MYLVLKNMVFKKTSNTSTKISLWYILLFLSSEVCKRYMDVNDFGRFLPHLSNFIFDSTKIQIMILDIILLIANNNYKYDSSERTYK